MTTIRVVPRAKRDPREGSARTGLPGEVWSHLGLVVLVGVASQLVMAVAWATQEGQSFFPSLAAALPAVGGLAYGMLPIAVGASVALAQRVTRQGMMRLAMVGTLAMIVADVGGPVVRLEVGQLLRVIGDETFSAPRFADLSRASAIRGSVELLREDRRALAERLERYPAGHPRVKATQVLTKGSLLALPMLMVAVIGALLTLIDDQVVFWKRPTRRIARLWVGWLISPAVFWLWATWVGRARTSALLGSAPLTVILLPVIVLAPIAWLAWRTLPADVTE
jgi:hypothetical protein